MRILNIREQDLTNENIRYIIYIHMYVHTPYLNISLFESISLFIPVSYFPLFIVLSLSLSLSLLLSLSLPLSLYLSYLLIFCLCVIIQGRPRRSGKMRQLPSRKAVKVLDFRFKGHLCHRLLSSLINFLPVTPAA